MKSTSNNKNTNVVYCLVNGGPHEWAIVRKLAEGERTDGTYVVRFDGVSDDLAAEIEASGKPSHFWEELTALPHQTL